VRGAELWSAVWARAGNVVKASTLDAAANNRRFLVGCTLVVSSECVLSVLANNS
jgi:hypothetical protein